MNLHLPVRSQTSWRDRALTAEAELQRCSRLNAEQAARISILDAENERQANLLGVYERAVTRLRLVAAGEEVAR